MFNKFKEYPIEYLLLAITICLQFYRLGIGEIQPWDEALYVIRAKACLVHGAWLDQTPYAVGGLYSSTHPPLLIWIMALFVKVLGESEFVWRLPSAIFACIGVVVMYKMIRLTLAKRTALLAAILFGNAQIWLWYGHHAQLDIAMHAMLIVVLYFYHKGMRGDTKSLVIAGVALGISLMIKAFQPLYVVPFLVMYGYFNEKFVGLRTAFIVMAIGLAVALPWYFMMAFSHSEYFLEWGGLFGSLAAGTYHGRTGSWWYYLNQTVVNFPFVAFLLLSILQFRKQKIGRVLISALAWYAIMLLLVSLMQTNMPHFILFLAIPIIISSANGIDLALKADLRSNVIVGVLALLAILWSGSEQIRLLVKGQLPFLIEYDLAAIIVILFVGILLLTLLAKYERSARIAVSLALLMVFGNVYRWYVKSDNVFIDGALLSIKLTDSLKAKNILAVHSDVAHEELLPQLTYYKTLASYGDSMMLVPVSKSSFEKEFSNEFVAGYNAAIIYDPTNRYYKQSIDEKQKLAILDSALLSFYKNRTRYQKHTVYY